MASSEHAFGVFKPVGHVVISFADAGLADAAAKEMTDAGFGGADALRRYSDRAMLAQIDHDLQHASAIASIGQELNLVKAHRALAERGYHWIVVRARNDADAQRIAEIAGRHDAERAQQYGQFVIEELIEHPDDEARVAESPDRGLDAQTPSGEEGERAARHRPDGDQGR